MNKKQLITMWTGIGIMVLIALFPPTLVSITKNKPTLPDDTLDDFRYAGYEIALRPVLLFSIVDEQKEPQYDIMALCQFIAALITGGLIITFKGKKQKDEQEQ